MRTRSPIVWIVGLALLVGACSGGAATATSTSADGGGAGANGLPGSACGLLSAAEVQQNVGSPVQAGVEQDTATEVGCNWNESSATGPSAGITVAVYDDAVWQAGAHAGNSTAVSGIGDAAFKGWPTPGTLNIKFKGYMITVGVTDFSKPSSVADAESLALASLVLPRL